MNIVGVTADVIGILSGFFALLAWLNTIRIRRDTKHEKVRLSQKVKLVLKEIDGEGFIQLPGEMRRQEVTRAEVLGWVGMLPMKVKGRRFDIGYNNSAEFLSQISQVQTGEGEVTFVILCSQAELDQFDIEIRQPKQAVPSANPA